MRQSERADDSIRLSRCLGTRYVLDYEAHFTDDLGLDPRGVRNLPLKVKGVQKIYDLEEGEGVTIGY